MKSKKEGNMQRLREEDFKAINLWTDETKLLLQNSECSCQITTQHLPILSFIFCSLPPSSNTRVSRQILLQDCKTIAAIFRFYVFICTADNQILGFFTTDVKAIILIFLIQFAKHIISTSYLTQKSLTIDKIKGIWKNSFPI